jgi:acetyl-CoA/propionyl-CoA carboxylase biotin carboxyl carrier protein
MQTVLIANRGEIAVRVARACADAGLRSIAVYAEPDADSVHVRAADEAYSLGGSTPADSYLDIAKLLAVAAQSGADSVHPGYGFLSENADFAQAVIDAGLTWIGPSPQSIRDLGDKVTARHIATRAGAPLVPGTAETVSGSAEVVAFAQEFGLPVAIKAAFGGGGRGLKVARTIEEIPELYDSAVREAISAFGRGECFVERYLDRPRHVEAQVLADTHGNVVVIGTRDCSLQRRHQKLVEEAPAPFLTADQQDRIHRAAKAICAEAGYYGAGTVEFLVGLDGTISFPRSTPVSRWSTRSPRRPAGSTWSWSSSASPTARSSSTAGIRSPVGIPSSSGSMARTPAAGFYRPPAPSRRSWLRPAPGCASTPGWNPVPWSRVLSTHCWPR